MYANEAFDALGFTQEEKYNVFKNTACMMHMGNMTKDFVPVGKDEQAEVKDETNSQKVAELLGESHDLNCMRFDVDVKLQALIANG